MGVERVKEHREVELDIDTDASTVFEFWTELPGQSMALRYSFTFNTENTTTGRRPVNFRLPGYVKGKLAKVRITTAGPVRLFGAKVLVRYVGSNSPWDWAELPVESTSPLFTQASLPIEPTAEQYSIAALPIDPTPDEFTQAGLPIPGTADDFSASQLPIDPTPDEFSLFALPFPQTPSQPIWVDIPVDGP